jgi:hypothetical protein
VVFLRYRSPLMIHLHMFVHDTNHGLINYKDTKAKFRYLTKFTCKGTLRQVFIRVYSLEIQSVILLFRPSFVNCCPSPLLWFNSPRYTPTCVNKYTVYTYTVCRGGDMDFWPSDRYTPAAKSLYRTIFLDDNILHFLL